MPDEKRRFERQGKEIIVLGKKIPIKLQSTTATMLMEMFSDQFPKEEVLEIHCYRRFSLMERCFMLKPGQIGSKGNNFWIILIILVYFPLISDQFHCISSSNLAIFGGEVLRYCSIQDVFVIKSAPDDQDAIIRCLAVVSLFPKNSDTLYWRVLNVKSNRTLLLNCFDIKGKFILFDSFENLMIGIPIKK